MVVQRVVALKHAVNAVKEAAVGVQPCDFVLVFVGHELEQVAGHCLGQRCCAHCGVFGLLHLGDKGAVNLGVDGILVVA